MTDALDLSLIHDVLRPHYKKWQRGDGVPGRPPHNPVGMVLAMLLMLVQEWSRPDFTAFLRNHPEWLAFLGFDSVPEETCWSKLLARVPLDALEDLLTRLVRSLRDEGLLKLYVAAVDGSFLPACAWDPDAAWGYVRKVQDRPKAMPSGRFQVQDGKVLGYGYRVHVLVDAASELPVTVHVTRANVHDVTAWPEVHRASRGRVDWDRVQDLVGDAAFDAAVVRTSLRGKRVRVVTPPTNLPDRLPSPGLSAELEEVYRQRDAVERFFAMMKGFFRLDRWGVTGLERVRKWVVLACCACLVVGVVNHVEGRGVKSVKGFCRAVR